MPYSYDRSRSIVAGDSFDSFWEEITMRASHKIRDLDESFIGTPDYMGIAYFWSRDYKFSMREAPPSKRRAVHQAFLKAGLDVHEASPEHEAIVKKLVGL